VRCEGRGGGSASTKSNISTSLLSICCGEKFTRVQAVDIGVYCVNTQARGFLLPEISAPPPYLGKDYKKNGFGEKRGRVRLSRFSGRRMGERYGARVGKAEIGRGFKKERECAGVERTRVGREFGKQRKDRGTSGRVLGCLTVRASQNSIIIGSFFLCCNLLLRCHSLLRCHLFLRRHQFLRRYPCFRVQTHKQKHVCVVRECVVEQQAEKEGQVGSRK